MKIGRNSPCPCGSGKKYKHCCLNKLHLNEYDQIRATVKQSGYQDEIANVLCNLLQHMKETDWYGACHATSSVLFVGLSEMGYSPKLCVGEVRNKNNGDLFDHSWIEVDGKIIDLAISMPEVEGMPLPQPIVFSLNIATSEAPNYIYGVEDGYGLDFTAMSVTKKSFVTYMDNYTRKNETVTDGLWGVVRKIIPQCIDIETLRQKYTSSPWNYIRGG